MELSFGTHPNRWEDVKICTYAMCKNELKFLENWVKNIWNNGEGSDYITILDTGSTDGTWEKLQTIAQEVGIPEGHFIVAQKIISPWRFDVARNESMTLIPTDKIDACFTVDLDEEVIPDFWADFKKAVFEHPNFKRIYYNYAWRLKSDGTPEWCFWYDKTHGPINWKWEFPVHETLVCSTPEIYDGTIWYLDASKIYVKHHPDLSKSRNSYLPLLEIRAKENPNDTTSNYYLAREYSYVSNWNKALEQCKVAIEVADKNNEISYDPDLYATILTLAGESAYRLGKRDEAISYLKKSIEKVPTFRSSYIWLAQIYAYSNKPQETYNTLSLMNRQSRKQNNWKIPGWVNSSWKELQIIADAKAWEGKYEEAYNLISQAYDQITNAEVGLAITTKFYEDYKFIKAKHEKSAKSLIVSQTKFTPATENKLKFSAVIPYHHESPELVYPLLYSIDGQIGFDFSEMEILICSSDGDTSTFDVSQFLHIKDRIRFISEKYDVSGPGQSKQIGLEHAVGKYITFYDCDDTLYAYDVYYKAFKEIENTLAKNPSVEEFIYNYVDEKYGKVIYQTYNLAEVVPYVQWCAIYDRLFLIRNKLYFNTEIAISEDVYFTLNLLLHKVISYKSDICMYMHRMRRTSTGNTWLFTSNRVEDTHQLALRLMKNYGDVNRAEAHRLASDAYWESFYSVYTHSNDFEDFGSDIKFKLIKDMVDYISTYGPDMQYTNRFTTTPKVGIELIKNIYHQYKSNK